MLSIAEKLFALVIQTSYKPSKEATKKMVDVSLFLRLACNMEHLIEPEFFSFFNSTIKKVLASLYGSSSCKNWKIERTFIGNIFPSSNLDLKTLSLLSSGYQKAMQN